MTDFRCPVCGFIQMYGLMRATDGAIFDKPMKEAHRTCPNDRTVLLLVTDETNEVLQ